MVMSDDILITFKENMMWLAKITIFLKILGQRFKGKKTTTMLETLKYIRDNGPVDHDAGICHNVEILTGWENRFKIKKYFVAWEHYSGSIVHPIPDPSGKLAPYSIYDKTSKNMMWNDSESEYAKLRWDLLDHLIKCFEEEEQNGN